MWDRTAAAYERRHASVLRRDGGAAWGTFRISERRLRLLGDVRGKDVLELGCGSAGWSIALSRAGARPVGMDFSPVRLAQASERMRAARVRFPLVEARAEAIPFSDDRFDIVLSDYGATTFTDPYRTVPEAARVLRPGGRFVFAHMSPLRSLTQDARNDHQTRRLMRDYFGLHELRDRYSVEFQLPYGEWIGLFGRCGLSVESLLEPVAPRTWRTSYFSARDQDWGRHWPIESIWQLRKSAPSLGRSGRNGGQRPRPATRSRRGGRP